MKWKKKAASLLLAGCMAISMVPATAFAVDSTTIERNANADVPDTVKAVAAPLVDNQSGGNKIESLIDDGGLTVKTEAVAGEENTYKVTVTGSNLKCHKSKDSGGKEAYWCGVGVPFMGSATSESKYQFKWGFGTLEDSTKANTSDRTDTYENKYSTFYWGLKADKTKNHGYLIVEEKTGSKVVAKYDIDFTGVTLAQPEIKNIYFDASGTDVNGKAAFDNSDSWLNTMWIELEDYMGGYDGAIRVYKDGDEKDAILTGASAGRYTKYAWSFNNAAQTQGLKLESGKYNVELYRLNSAVWEENRESLTWDKVDETKWQNRIDRDPIAETSITLHKVVFDKDGDGKEKADGSETTYYKEGDTVTIPADVKVTVLSNDIKNDVTVDGWKNTTTGEIKKAKETVTVNSDMTFVPNTALITLEDAPVVEKSIVDGETLTSKVVTNEDNGTITLSGSINDLGDKTKEVTLKLDCTNDKSCKVHKDADGSEKTKKIKLSHLEGNLVAEPQFITVHGIKYAIKLDITEKPTNVEVETAVAAPKTDAEAIKDPTAKAAVEENIDDTTAKLTDSKEIMKQVDAVVASLGDKEDVEALLAEAGERDSKTYTTLDVETYVEVKATEYKPDGDDAHLSVDITPYIKLVPEDADGTKGKPIGEPTKVNTDEETLVDVTVGVPSALANKIQTRTGTNAKKADIIHTKENGNQYLYISEELTSQSTSVEFQTRGFSGYDIYPVSQAAVEVTVNGVTTPYSSLQAAVDSLKDGDEATIKLLKACPDTATTDKKVKITIDAGTFGFSGNILNSKYTDADNASNIYDFKNGSQKPGTQPGGPGTDPGPNPGNPSNGTTGGTTSNHNVTVKTAENGSVTASATSNIAPNTEVTLTVKPADGYVLDTLKATISSGEVALTKVNDTTYTFKMPTADVTITPTFKLASEQKPDEDTVCKPYTDVDSSYAYHDQVHYMIENKLMTGVSANTFGLNVVLNRAMVAQILYSKAEPTKPSYTVTNSFSDVKAGDWFANSVTWAESNGVTDGYGDGTFRPYNQVTREELVTMLYGEADQPDVTGNLSAYTDASSVSDWAVKAMTWAIENGVVTGTTATTLSPKNTTPRYQAAIMFYKYFTK